MNQNNQHFQLSEMSIRIYLTEEKEQEKQKEQKLKEQLDQKQ